MPKMRQIGVGSSILAALGRKNMELTVASLSVLVAQCAIAGPLKAVHTGAGQFFPPRNESQKWEACAKRGYKQDQYHLEWNPDYGAHSGEDWNGRCGGATDSGGELTAMADGKVVYIDRVDDTGKGLQVHVRYTIPYNFGDRGRLVCDSLHLHLSKIGAGARWSGAGTGSTVKAGDTLGYIGGSGGWIPHDHHEMQCDDDPELFSGNNYRDPLTKQHALKLLPPSLVLDDRRDVISIEESADWEVFQFPVSAPSSTAWVQAGNTRISLSEAVKVGWITSQSLLAYNPEGDRWTYLEDITNNFFVGGRYYAFKPSRDGVKLYVPVPRNTRRADRARLDMLSSVGDDPRFDIVLAHSYRYDASWDRNWELHMLAFQTNEGTVSWVAQATNRSEPLYRVTMHQHPRTGAWSGWVRVDPNDLYGKRF